MTIRAHQAILEGKLVKPVENIITWAKWFEANRGKRHVGLYECGDIRVSTVFLGINHGLGGSPLWFETMIFGGEHNEYCERYETWEQAEEGHKRAIEMVKE